MKDLDYTLNPEILQKLNQAEEQALMTSKQSRITDLGGIQRLQNVAMKNKADKLLS